ncbi:MAG: DUF6159 family protein [Bacteroidetes bacterium]|nr:DUF6159 family protein [Bacteroidota bacterium]
MSFADRISNGWNIAMNSFKILRENKQLVIFPILSGISIVLIIGSFFTAQLAAAGWDAESINLEDKSPVFYFLLSFAFYVVNYFVVVFFNMALIHCTRLYFRGEEVTVRKGIQYSMSRLSVIFSWALVAATVGVILRTIQENSGLLGKIVAGVIGIVWSVATFFVVPVIAYENVGPIDAVKRSTAMMKEKWGESLVANFSFSIIYFLGSLLAGITLYFIGSIFSPVLGVFLAIAGVLSILAIISAAQTIFVSAVYHNITGDPVKYINQQMVDDLFGKK